MENILKILLNRFDTLDKRMIETREDVASIITKIDGYNGLREKVDKACYLTENNAKRIKKLESTWSWLNKAIWGAVIGVVVTLILTKGLW